MPRIGLDSEHAHSWLLGEQVAAGLRQLRVVEADDNELRMRRAGRIGHRRRRGGSAHYGHVRLPRERSIQQSLHKLRQVDQQDPDGLNRTSLDPRVSARRRPATMDHAIRIRFSLRD